MSLFPNAFSLENTSFKYSQFTFIYFKYYQLNGHSFRSEHYPNMEHFRKYLARDFFQNEKIERIELQETPLCTGNVLSKILQPIYDIQYNKMIQP